jgi:hypothetical protein
MLTLSNAKADKIEVQSVDTNFESQLRLLNLNQTKTQDDLLTLENYCERYQPLQNIEMLESVLANVFVDEQKATFN